jgi:sugar phosphate isomerase/epimerase
MKRRDFVKTAGTFGVLAFLKPASFFEEKAGAPIGIQLWSVRDAMYKDPKGTLTAIAGQGYQFVESFGFKDGGYFGLPVAEYKAVLKGLGLKTPSGHHMLELKCFDKKTGLLNDDFKRNVEAANTLGQKYFVLPYMIESERNLESCKVFKDMFQAAGTYCKKHGLKFAYHNHAFEFDIKFGDQTMYQYLLDNTDPKLVKFEMDMGWTARAGQNPVDWFKKYPGRFHLSHMKDMVGTTEDTSTIIGNGIVDFTSIVEHKKLAGMRHWIIEVEHYKNGSVTDAGVCYKNLRKLV